MRLDVDPARTTVAERVAGPLGLSLEAAAGGIIKLATARMAQLISEMTVQVGLDPRDYAVVGFGGAGPLFAGALAQEMEASYVIIPLYPAVWSAFGGLFADVLHHYAQSHVVNLDELGLTTIDAMGNALAELARHDLARDGAPEAEATFAFAFDVRYAGQSHEITVPVEGGPPFSRATVRQAERDFEALHEKTYAHRRPEEPRQLITLRLTVRVPRRLKLPVPRLPDAAAARPRRRRRRVWLHGHDHGLMATVLDRDALPSGFRISGPAIVEEAQSTTLVPPEMRLRVNLRGDLVIERRQS